MATITRRTFLKGGLAALVGGSFMPAMFGRTVAAFFGRGPSSAGDAASRTLIVVQLAGGNDGLNTVVPYDDPRYRQLRPTLAIPADQVEKLDDRLGLHSSLKPLKPIWDAGQLAIVENVGYERPSLSHFQGMDIWQTADPTFQLRQGWLSSVADGSMDPTAQTLRAVSMGQTLARALCCLSVPPPALASLSDYQLQPDPRYRAGQSAREEALRRLYAASTSPTPFTGLLRATAEAAQRSSKALHEVVAQHQPAATYPKGSLGDGLKLLAALISGDLGLRVGYVTLGGFDTHSNQANRHTALLKGFAEAVAAFHADIAAHGRADDVLLMTWSEFGRRVGENGNRGTDHGTAAPLFVLGAGVKGGIHGDPPDLDRLENGNLRYATDFRSVYATVLEGWLQSDSAAILGQRFPLLPIL